MTTSKTIRLTIAAIFVFALGACAQAGGNMQGEDQAMKEKTMMDKKADGMFMGSDGHMASGKAEITEAMGGKTVLKLSDINVDKVPDGYVYLAKGADHMSGVSVGKLEQFKGTVEFPIPMGVDPHDYDSVVIWCKKFNVEIGRAWLPKKMM
jgi:hypothetical protein